MLLELLRNCEASYYNKTRTGDVGEKIENFNCQFLLFFLVISLQECLQWNFKDGRFIVRW